jgi:UDP-glucose 4-epimerase
MTVLVTGGAGYIGSHTIIELIQKGFKKIIAVDNYSNSNEKTYERIRQITKFKVQFYDTDLTSKDACEQIFIENKIDAIIHFAAFKSVPESVENPTLYYHNNLNSLINILDAAKKYHCNQLIFSSSCSVYGNSKSLPVTEDTLLEPAESPYARTKLFSEQIILDFVKTNSAFKAIILRYFNPVGSHISGLNGELPSDRPNNLVPFITEVATGNKKSLRVFGGNYNTKDGTCIRDYIHVTDIADAHVLALDYISTDTNNYTVFNLGTGIGVTVLEVIESFERMNNLKLNYEIVDRRKGDVEAVYANNEKALKKLGWRPKYSLDDMMESAWKWQLHLLSEDN